MSFEDRLELPWLKLVPGTYLFQNVRTACTIIFVIVREAVAETRGWLLGAQCQIEVTSIVSPRETGRGQRDRQRETLRPTKETDGRGRKTKDKTVFSLWRR